VHLERAWAENRFTVEGKNFHERVHETGSEARNQVRIVRGISIRSLRLGLVGVADVVEFHPVEPPAGITISTVSGRWLPFPIEYKRGQLCAQAICLEEMLLGVIPRGAVFYGKTRRRLDVDFTPALRSQTEQATAHLHAMINEGKTPIARYEKKCDRCSLYELCQPKTTGRGESVRAYLEKMLEDG